MDKKNLCDLDVAGQKVLVRVDYNVPMDETGKITDDTRICASLETIKYLLEHKAAVILMAHLGRPKGQVNIKYSLTAANSPQWFIGNNQNFRFIRSNAL